MAFTVAEVLFAALLVGGLVDFNKVFQELDRIHEEVGEIAKAKPIAHESGWLRTVSKGQSTE